MTPEHYFDQLPDRVMQRIGQERKISIRTIRSYGKWVAVFLLGFLGGLLSYNIHAHVNKANYSVEIVDETIFNNQFNPTCDEIIEYLVSEVEDYETLIAGNY